MNLLATHLFVMYGDMTIATRCWYVHENRSLIESCDELLISDPVDPTTCAFTELRVRWTFISETTHVYVFLEFSAHLDTFTIAARCSC